MPGPQPYACWHQPTRALSCSSGGPASPPSRQQASWRKVRAVARQIRCAPFFGAVALVCVRSSVGR